MTAALGALPDSPRLIGLMGKKRSGKDTFAQGLLEGGFRRFAFADIMKTAALMADPYVLLGSCPCGCGDDDDFDRLSRVVAEEGWERAKEYEDVRRYLQRFGTEVGRNLFGEDFWVDRTMAEVTAQTDPAVITDVRFPNEAEAIRRAGGLLVRITRPAMSVATDPHPSETALDHYLADVTVVNAGTAEALVARARTFV